MKVQTDFYFWPAQPTCGGAQKVGGADRPPCDLYLKRVGDVGVEVHEVATEGCGRELQPALREAI